MKIRENQGKQRHRSLKKSYCWQRICDIKDTFLVYPQTILYCTGTDSQSYTEKHSEGYFDSCRCSCVVKHNYIYKDSTQYKDSIVNTIKKTSQMAAITYCVKIILIEYQLFLFYHRVLQSNML